jgi:hypothetical protein
MEQSPRYEALMNPDRPCGGGGLHLAPDGGSGADVLADVVTRTARGVGE